MDLTAKIVQARTAVQKAKFLQICRNEERRAERPTPFCCTEVAGLGLRVYISMPYQLSPLRDGVPSWYLEGHIDTPLKNCPYCGKALPELVFKEPHPSRKVERVVVGSNFHTAWAHCNTCNSDAVDCLCSDRESCWEVKNAPPIRAVVGLLQTKVEKGFPYYLSVSRKGDPKALGLPGGSIEEGETLEEALAREFKEETGLIVLNCHKALDVLDDFNHRVVFFRVTEWAGTLQTEEAGLVKEVIYHHLVNDSPFSRSNKALLRVLRKTGGEFHPQILT